MMISGPLILHHNYDDKTKKLIGSCALEWIAVKLDHIHKVNQNTGAESYKPMGVKTLVKAFNETYFLKAPLMKSQNTLQTAKLVH